MSHLHRYLESAAERFGDQIAILEPEGGAVTYRQLNELADRVRNREALEPLLDDQFAQHKANYWLDQLRDARIPCGPVNSLPEILVDEHFTQRGGVVEIDGVTYRLVTASVSVNCPIARDRDVVDLLV